MKETDIIPEVIDTLASVATDLKFRKLILLIDEHLHMKYLDRYSHYSKYLVCEFCKSAIM